jgi:hypothetical protein
MNAWHPSPIELREVIRAKIEKMRPRRLRITPQPANVHPVADLREWLEQPNAMIELYGCAAKVVFRKQVVQADANLKDAFVQVADLLGRRAPQQFECFMLLEKLACIELVDRLKQLRWRRRGAGTDQVSCFETLEGGHQFRVVRAEWGGLRKG